MSSGSNVERDEAIALARAFARHLEHLRMFRGVHYIGAGAVPIGAGAVPIGAGAVPVGAGIPQAHPELEPTRSADDEPLQAEAPPARAEHSRVYEASLTSRPSRASEPASTYGPASADEPASADKPASDVEPASPSPEQWSAAKKLQYLRERNVGDCRRCPLAATRRNIVFGVGDPDADLMFVGEAPGADEDRLGEPFVGAAGKRLDQWITHLGLRRDQVYIANVLKCRPPNNRNPQALEIERCSPFLHAQIRAIEPKVIVALGRFAGCLLLGRELKLHQMRDAVHQYREPKSGNEIPLVVTYHPSYVLRSEQGSDARAKPDRGAPIKSEDEKVRADLERARSLVRARVP
jgi:uracil-DNA glycosylase